MFDIHSHIIWAVDDGSTSLEMSQEMIKQAANCGTTHLFSTSHIIDHTTRPSWDLINERLKQLQGFADSNNLNITLHPGGEVYMNWELLEHLTSSKEYCLANSRYLLVEFPMNDIPNYVDEFFYELRVANIVPILAHPERYRALYENKENLSRILQWRNEGLLYQINGGSITGFYGRTVKRNVEFLLENQLADFIGSDAHSTTHRNPDLSEARLQLQNLVSPKYYDKITNTNPQKIVADLPIQVLAPTKLTKLPKVKSSAKKSFWQKIFG